MPNPQLENGYTRISNEIMDALGHFRIPGEIRQVIDCIIRKTYGYGKKDDWITNSQFMQNTGLLKANISRSLSKAITHKLVIVTDNKLSLNKHFDEWISFKGNHFNPKQKLSNPIIPVIVTDLKVIGSDNKKLSEVMDTIDIKDNIQKKLLQKKEGKSLSLLKNKYSLISDIKEDDLIEIAEKYGGNNPNFLSFVKSELENMIIWAESRPNNPKLKDRNWRMTLIGFVKRDGMRIIERSRGDLSKRSTDARNL